MRPSAIVTSGSVCTRYIQNGYPTCIPPRSTRAWKPASPPRAMIRPSASDPRGAHSFSMMPTRPVRDVTHADEHIDTGNRDDGRGRDDAKRDERLNAHIDLPFYEAPTR